MHEKKKRAAYQEAMMEIYLDAVKSEESENGLYHHQQMKMDKILSEGYCCRMVSMRFC